MVDGSITPLFDTDNMRSESEIFQLFPGWIAILSIHGFPDIPVPGAPGEFYALPGICLHRILLSSLPEELADNPCGVVAFSKPEIVIIADDEVTTDGCPWRMDACDNLRLLAVPGVYYFVLSDPALAGQVQAYVKFYHSNELPGFGLWPFFGG
jgi:hypothetical protein